MNVQQIKVELKDRGLDFKPNAKGVKLLEILNDSLAANGEELVELTDDAEPAEDADKPTSEAEKAKRAEPGPRTADAKSADAKLPNTSVPAYVKPIRKKIWPGERGGEYKNLKLVKGETVKVFMLRNVRHNGARFLQGSEYIVTKKLAQEFINEEYAE